jgi:LmbE family N-acetylglucosaminyl deacetylase
MLEMKFFAGSKEPKILCLGAHSDDIEIGCGGTILKLIGAAPKAEFRWIVFSGNKLRHDEALQSASAYLNPVDEKQIDIHSFRESYFPFIGAQIKDCFEKVKSEYDPDIIFTHCASDAHQDHILISKLTLNTFRNHMIIEYEIPKYDGDLGNPNVFVHLDESIVRKKIAIICTIFQTQTNKLWFSEESFRSLLRIRGIESNSPTNYAEGFYCHKMILR